MSIVIAIIIACYMCDMLFLKLIVDWDYLVILYRKDVIRNIIIILLPGKSLFSLFYGIRLLINYIKRKYKELPSYKQEKVILQEKAQKQSGNLSIVEKDDTGGLSVV